ncbi:MAG TPA: hypothetical protein VF276_04535 [Chloroflexia bacterium]
MSDNREVKMKSGAARRARLAWGLLALGLALLALGLLLLALHGALSSNVIGYLLAFNAFLLVGGVVAARRPEHPIGWLFLGVGLSTNLALALNEYALLALVRSPGSLPGGAPAAWLALILQPGAWWLVFNSLLLFPTGRPVSPRWGVVLGLAGAYAVFALVLDAFAFPMLTFDPLPNPYYTSALAPYSGPVNSVYGFGYVLLILITAVLRFRRSGAIERLQLKWLTYSIFLAALLSLVQLLSGVLGIPSGVFANAAILQIFLFAAAIGIAILRYRLYEIDIIIRRTLIYAVLTALLAAVYFGGVTVLQVLLRPLLGANNDLAVVATTLLIAALFFPLRQRVQRFIDRRFYRRKYDAAKTLAAFSHTVRDEVELEQLTGRLVQVVDETMQPRHVSLWLKGVPRAEEVRS